MIAKYTSLRNFLDSLRVGTRVSGHLNERMWSEAFLMAFSCSTKDDIREMDETLTNVVGSLFHAFTRAT
jgi:hypothetical protein